MACIFPKASHLDGYWQNILDRVDAIGEIPAGHWDWREYFHPDRLARDKIYSRWGGFISDIPFDASRYGIAPRTMEQVDPMQLLVLETTRAALADAGYENRTFPRERTAVVIANAGHGPNTALYSLRSMIGWKMRDMDEGYKRVLEERLPEWTEDTFPGFLGNVTAGRVANRFDLAGMNFTIDAACASSLAALHVGMRELQAGGCDMVLVSATDTHNQPADYLSFSKVQALSPTGRCRTFAADSDGIVISEGIATLVLKRLSDAQADGDRIYAVVRGIGSSSDGRDLSLTAPRPDGQIMALERAYADAGISPCSIGLVEAHGTGTIAGDRAEIEALTRVFQAQGAGRQSCAIGSVKTMIGHSKCAAGLASIIKAAKGLYHKVLPPTMPVEQPNPYCAFSGSPFYINSQVRPWMQRADRTPRRAAVSAFGFGGTNFHAVLEEYEPARSTGPNPPAGAWAAELFLLRAPGREGLNQLLDRLESLATPGAEPLAEGPAFDTRRTTLAQVSWLWSQQSEAAPRPDGAPALALVASSLADLREKIARAKTLLSSAETREIRDPRGIYFTARPLASGGKVAFLFPGQGSQSKNMFRDLCLNFSEVREAFEQADRVLAGRLPRPLSESVFPLPTSGTEGAAGAAGALAGPRQAQPALAAASLGAFHMMENLGVVPDMVAGHSFGEHIALSAAGRLAEKDLVCLGERLGERLENRDGQHSGAMAAVSASPHEIESLMAGSDGLTLANINAPNQCIIAGRRKKVEEAAENLNSRNVKATVLPVPAAFHSAEMADASAFLAAELAGLAIGPARLPVYCNTTAAVYPDEPDAVRRQLAAHLGEPVRFLDEVERMYDDGARIFVEVGPGNVISGLVGSILQSRPHLALPIDRPGRDGVVQLMHVLAELAAHGVPVDISRLAQARLPEATRAWAGPQPSIPPVSRPAMQFLVNSTRVRRAADFTEKPPQPEPLKAKAARQPDGAPAAPAPAPAAVPGPGPVSSAVKALPAQQVGRNTEANSLTGPAGSRELPATASAAAVMVAFQKASLAMTRACLEVQEEVMLAFLGQEAKVMLPSTSRPDRGPAALPLLPAEDATALRALAPFAPGAHRAVSRAEVVLEELSANPHILPPPDGVVLVACPDPELARLVVSELARLGVKGAQLAPGNQPPAADWWSSSERAGQADMERAVDRLRREHGKIGGLVFLPDGAAGERSGARAFDSYFQPLRALFLLARLLAPDLKSGRDKLFLTATTLGGDFGLSPVRQAPDDLAAGACQAALAGLVKTVAREWPGIRARAVDFSSGEKAAVKAAAIAREALAAGERVEIGHQAGLRLGLKAMTQPLPADLPAGEKLPLDPSSLILVTGGARGITAEICLRLAREYRPNLVIVGRTARPAPSESPATAGISDRRQLKAAIIERLGHEGRTISVRAVEAEYQRLLVEREIRENLRRLEQSGSTVHYFPVDVCDGHAFRSLIEGVYARHGAIDGVIHGAGVIEDEYIQDKSPESFERVFKTKVASAHTLCAALDLSRLKFMVLFSSVVGRTGNPGQADYVAANSALNHLASSLQTSACGRVVSMMWGPWRGGMARPELTDLFTSYGWSAIEPEDGWLAFHDELRLGRGRKSQVLLVGAIEGLLGAHLRTEATASAGMLAKPAHNASAGPADARAVEGGLLRRQQPR